MTYTTLEVEVKDRVAVLTLNRPQQMNAMDYTMMRELADFFESMHEQSGVHLLIIKGAGKVFSAGGDVKLMMQTGDVNDFGNIMGDISRLVRAYYTLPMITIAQIHGAAAGLGFSLALGSDFIVAEKSSKLAMNFIGIGLVPDGGGHFFMKERVGSVKAKQMIWEGRVLNADEAKQQNLIDYAVEDGVSGQVVESLTKKILNAPILAMLETKKIIHAANLPNLEAILQGEEAGQTKMRGTKDHHEGIASFVEKRRPQFVGQ